MAKAVPRKLLFFLAAMTMPVLLGGCFAMEKDLDPIRSDVAILEKQFVDMQRDVIQVKQKVEEGPEIPRKVTDALLDNQARLAAFEKRLDRMDAQLREQKQTQAEPVPEPVPEPVAPEPVVITPMEETPKAPPAEPAAQPEEDLYKESLKALDAGDYGKAEAGFTDFLARNPKDRLADNARVGLGQAYLGRREYEIALREFERVTADFPTGDKVPDALYHMGVTYEKMGQPGKAREAYTRLMDNYPYSDAAKTAHQRLDSKQ